MVYMDPREQQRWDRRRQTVRSDADWLLRLGGFFLRAGIWIFAWILLAYVVVTGELTPWTLVWGSLVVGFILWVYWKGQRDQR